MTARMVTEPRPGAVRLLDAGAADDEAAAGEVGALDAMHGRVEEFLAGGLRVGQRPLDGVVDLAQVVRGDVGGHADGNAGGAVDEQVREARREDDGLLLAVVVVGLEVDGVLLDLAHHLDGERRHLALGVPHGGGLVVALAAEVALAGHQRVPHGPRLREAHEGVVDGGVAVGVVEAHDLAHHAGALVPAAVRAVAAVPHRVQDATVDGLEPVAHVRQGAPHDDAHCVVEVGALDLHLEVDGVNAPEGGRNQVCVVSHASVNLPGGEEIQLLSEPSPRNLSGPLRL